VPGRRTEISSPTRRRQGARRVPARCCWEVARDHASPWKQRAPASARGGESPLHRQISAHTFLQIALPRTRARPNSTGAATSSSSGYRIPHKEALPPLARHQLGRKEPRVQGAMERPADRSCPKRRLPPSAAAPD